MRKDEKEFLEQLAEYSSYWANLPEDKLYSLPTENKQETRINGFIHSWLVLLRGDSGANDFTPYRLYRYNSQKEIGENEYLPSRYFQIWEKMNKVEEDRW